MLWVFLDSSALVKRYVPEEGTPLLNELFLRHPPEHMVCSTMSILEITATLVRKRNDGRLSRAEFEQALVAFRGEITQYNSFRVLAVADQLFMSATEVILRHNVNATDALILCSAVALRQTLQQSPPGDDLVLWVADKRLTRAARSEGISVFDPEQETIASLRQASGQEDAP